MTVTHLDMTYPSTQKSMLRWLRSSLLSLTLAPACDVTPERELGETDPAPEPTPVEPRPEFISDFAGTWLGYAEDVLESASSGEPRPYAFPSGATQILLEVIGPDRNERGFNFGRITFGEGVPPAPATDPSVGYPPDPDFSMNSPGADDGGKLPPVEGFPYRIGFYTANSTDMDLWLEEHPERSPLSLPENDFVIDGRLNASWDTDEFYASWCDLLTPADCDLPLGIGYDADGRNCARGGTGEPMDCLKAAMCISERCTDLSGEPARRANLHLRYTNEGLVGVFEEAPFINQRGYRTQLGAVRFQRVEAAATGANQ